jgi:hypothetical protein
MGTTREGISRSGEGCNGPRCRVPPNLRGFSDNNESGEMEDDDQQAKKANEVGSMPRYTVHTEDKRKYR